MDSFVTRKGRIDQKKKKNHEDAIVKYLIKSNQPFEHVENSAYKEGIICHRSKFCHDECRQSKKNV